MNWFPSLWSMVWSMLLDATETAIIQRQPSSAPRGKLNRSHLVLSKQHIIQVSIPEPVFFMKGFMDTCRSVISSQHTLNNIIPQDGVLYHQNYFQPEMSLGIV